MQHFKSGYINPFGPEGSCLWKAEIAFFNIIWCLNQQRSLFVHSVALNSIGMDNFQPSGEISPWNFFAFPDLFKAFEKDRSHRWELLLSRTVVAYSGDHRRCWQHYAMEAWHSRQMNFTVFHSSSSTTSPWVKQHFHVISYPESIICHALNKALIQWWWIGRSEYKRPFSCPPVQE